MFDVNKVREDFPMIKNVNGIYFDSSATSFKPQCVIDAASDYYLHKNTNIHRGEYDLSFAVSEAYDSTREKVQQFLNAESSSEIVFTSGASDSLNTVAFGYLLEHVNEGDVILTTKVEHASSILPLFEVARIKRAVIRYIPLNKDGSFDLEKYEECFREKISFVEITAVSNVLGYKYPLKDIIRIAHEYGAVVSVDGAQAVPHMTIDVRDLDIDFLSFSGHKMCAPTGIGILYGKKALLEEMRPVRWGGGANARFFSDGKVILKEVPERFEAGTPHIEGVLGLSRAVDYLNELGMDNIEKYESELASYFAEKMSELDNVELYNPKADACIISFNVKGIFAQDVASYLNKQHICVRSGNHCAKLIGEVIGINDSIRASLYFYNTKEEIDYFVKTVSEVTLEKCIEASL